MNALKIKGQEDYQLFNLVTEQLFEEFKNIVIDWYAETVKRVDDFPDISLHAILGFDYADEVADWDYTGGMHDFQYKACRLFFANYNQDFPDDIELWTDDDDEFFDDQFCGGAYEYNNMLLDDVVRMLDILMLSYELDSQVLYRETTTLDTLYHVAVTEVW